MIKRSLEEIIREKLPLHKAVIIYGARQIGKSTMLQSLFAERNDVLWLNGEQNETKMLLDNVSPQRIRTVAKGCNVVVIDEAQNIENIGFKLKQIYDNIPELSIVATGSSSFDLANKINEPMTGRKLEYRMYALSFEEMAGEIGAFKEFGNIEHRMLYGYYPEVVTTSGMEAELLRNLASSYLYKDILVWENIRKSEKIDKLLRAIALQIGSQVSYTELGSLCGLTSKTVEKYIDLLEKAFVIFRLPSYSSNLRNELKFSKKIYFCDLGIRNAVLSNFSDLEVRTDVGAMWENLLISERMKHNGIHNPGVRSYFWRTQSQKEIDYIEEIDGRLYAYEFKWNEKCKAVVPKDFAAAYPDAEFKVISRENCLEFVLGE